MICWLCARALELAARDGRGGCERRPARPHVCQECTASTRALALLSPLAASTRPALPALTAQAAPRRAA
jgi:hypothetical protein